MGVLGGIFAILFGIFWTVMASNITRNSPFPGVGTFFPLFGVCFVVMAIAGVIYNLRNATGKDRFSTFDITTEREEPDPLNQMFGRGSGEEPEGGAKSVEQRLAELEALRSKGLVTAQEYQQKRAQILQSL